MTKHTITLRGKPIVFFLFDDALQVAMLKDGFQILWIKPVPVLERLRLLAYARERLASEGIQFIPSEVVQAA